MSSANEHLPPPPKPRMSPLEFRNTDLVSRLLAATPPYLYNMSLLPNTFFFSEMLRSFVQAKADPGRPPPFPARRARKRPWPAPPKTPPKPDDWAHRPLELTTKASGEGDKPAANKPYTEPKLGHEHHLSSIFAPEANPSSGLILPPPPPMWYPPLYPTAPYGIDPLHFFIDLRVSGHIYDRKKGETQEATATATKAEEEPEVPKIVDTKDGFRPSRHASAFSVPVPHSHKNFPMNLSHDESEAKKIKFPVKAMVDAKRCNRIGTNYVMNNITDIYRGLESRQHVEEDKGRREENVEGGENETEEQRQKRVKDLRALIGLELVVDYMNHAKPGRRVPDEGSSTDVESVGSPNVEVVALHDNP